MPIYHKSFFAELGGHLYYSLARTAKNKDMLLKPRSTRFCNKAFFVPTFPESPPK